jgi:hypothetical protein
MSKKRKSEVIRTLKTVLNIISLNLATKGNINIPTPTEPDEQRQARHATEEI